MSETEKPDKASELDIARWHFAAARYWLAIADNTIADVHEGFKKGVKDLSQIVPHDQCVETAKIHLEVAKFALDYSANPIGDDQTIYPEPME